MRVSSDKLQPPAQRGQPVQILVDGSQLTAYEGETIATALLAQDRQVLRYTKEGRPRGVFCAIGLCHECRMIVNGQPNVRACLTLVEPGMQVQTLDERSVSAASPGSEGMKRRTD